MHTIDSEAGSTVALLLHPFRPLVTSVDGGGTVRVHNYRHSTVINRFHVTGTVSHLTLALSVRSAAVLELYWPHHTWNLGVQTSG